MYGNVRSYKCVWSVTDHWVLYLQSFLSQFYCSRSLWLAVALSVFTVCHYRTISLINIYFVMFILWFCIFIIISVKNLQDVRKEMRGILQNGNVRWLFIKNWLYFRWHNVRNMVGGNLYLAPPPPPTRRSLTNPYTCDFLKEIQAVIDNHCLELTRALMSLLTTYGITNAFLYLVIGL